MRRLLPAVVVGVAVAGVMTYAASRMFGEVLVSGNGSEGFTCTWVPDSGQALALGSGFGVTAGLLFWLVLVLGHVSVLRQMWLTALAVIAASAVVVAVLFPPPDWGPPQECPPSIERQV